MRSILIGDPNQIGRVYSDETLKHLTAEAGLSAQVVTHTMLKEGSAETSDVECLFSTWGMPALSEEEIARHFPNLRVLFYAAGSVKGFASPFLARGVQISSAYAANAIPVAEYTVSQILLATKGFFSSSALYSRGEVAEARRVAASYPGNFSVRVGLIGVGMVGKAVCRLLKPYSIDLLVYDPTLYFVRLLLLALSIFGVALGVYLYCSVDLVPLPGDGVILALSQKSGMKFHNMKILFDCTLVVISAAISLIFLGGLVSVREGTVISSLLIGAVVGLLTRAFGKKS